MKTRHKGSHRLHRSPQTLKHSRFINNTIFICDSSSETQVHCKLNRKHSFYNMFLEAMFGCSTSRTCIIALLKSSLAAHKQIPSATVFASITSLPTRTPKASTVSGLDVSTCFANSIRFAANLRCAASAAIAAIAAFAAPPPSPLRRHRRFRRFRRSAASKTCAAISNRFTASFASPTPTLGNQPSLRSKPALPRKPALRYPLDQRRLYSEEPARCAPPSSTRRSLASLLRFTRSPPMTFIFTHDIHTPSSLFQPHPRLSHSFSQPQPRLSHLFLNPDHDFEFGR